MMFNTLNARFPEDILASCEIFRCGNYDGDDDETCEDYDPDEDLRMIYGEEDYDELYES